MKKAARDLIFGMKELPRQDGFWGFLLPKGLDGSKHEMRTAKAFQSIDERRLVFSSGMQASNRGFGFIFGLVIGLAFLSMSLWLFLNIGFDKDPDLFWTLLGFLAVPVLLSCAFFSWSFVSVRSTISPPVVLFKEARCFYYWLDKKSGWVRLCYDDVQPVNMIARMYSAAGGSTGYILAIVDMDQSTRRIRWYIPLAQPQRSIEVPGQLWEFIKQYMDGDPTVLPEIDPMPPADDSRADLARMDRFLYGDMVDENHRVAQGLFAKIYVGLVGVTMFWFERAGLWISRTAPRPVWPSEVADIMNFPQSSSSYRVRKPTEAERLASVGKLGHLNRRWFVTGGLSAILVFLMFAVLGIPPWFQ